MGDLKEALLTREQLRIASGTPEEFARAVWKACDDLWCTTAEAEAAIARYRKEYENAPLAHSQEPRRG